MSKNRKKRNSRPGNNNRGNVAPDPSAKPQGNRPLSEAVVQELKAERVDRSVWELKEELKKSEQIKAANRQLIDAKKKAIAEALKLMCKLICDNLGEAPSVWMNWIKVLIGKEVNCEEKRAATLKLIDEHREYLVSAKAESPGNSATNEPVVGGDEADGMGQEVTPSP